MTVDQLIAKLEGSGRRATGNGECRVLTSRYFQEHQADLTIVTEFEKTSPHTKGITETVVMLFGDGEGNGTDLAEVSSLDDIPMALRLAAQEYKRVATKHGDGKKGTAVWKLAAASLEVAAASIERATRRLSE